MRTSSSSPVGSLSSKERETDVQLKASLPDMRDLEMLMRVTEAGSFRGAAHVLGVEPSAVSRRIRTLEDRLGVSLFERLRSGVRTTDAGRHFEKEVRGIVGLLSGAVRTAQIAGTAGNGQIDIGVTGSMSSKHLHDLISTYRKECPGVSVQIAEGDYHDHAAGIVDTSLDVAIVVGPLAPEGCESELLWIENMFLALPSGNPRSAATTIPIESVTDEPFIVSALPPGPDVHDYIIRRLSQTGFHPRVTRHRVGREALLCMVGLGFGVSLVCGTEPIVAYPNVTFVPITDEQISYSAIWSRTNGNPALRRFLSLALRLSRKERKHVAAWRTLDPSP